VLARIDRAAVAVALEQPALVVGGGELAHGGAQILECGEAFDPEDLLLERLDDFSAQPLVSGSSW